MSFLQAPQSAPCRSSSGFLAHVQKGGGTPETRLLAVSRGTSEDGSPYFSFAFKNSCLCIGCQNLMRNVIIKVQICLEKKIVQAIARNKTSEISTQD